MNRVRSIRPNSRAAKAPSMTTTIFVSVRYYLGLGKGQSAVDSLRWGRELLGVVIGWLSEDVSACSFCHGAAMAFGWSSKTTESSSRSPIFSKKKRTVEGEFSSAVSMAETDA